MHITIALDQSTSATKAILFDDTCRLLYRTNLPHEQIYPQTGWVEHSAEEIYRNTLGVIRQAVNNAPEEVSSYSIAITNQRETVVVWDKTTGHPVYNAIVWQCQRGASYCEALRNEGAEDDIQTRSGLLADPYFSASGVRWILDNVKGAREKSERGDLLLGTIDSWLIWKLTDGAVHATDTTNACRTLLFNINTLDWDEKLCQYFTIPPSMLPKVLACDSYFGTTTVDDLFAEPIPIVGVLGDSHGALVGQMCFSRGMGKATYGTGSSVMVNIGTEVVHPPKGLVTSVGFSAFGKTYYAFEGNIHCTGATIKWLIEQLELIASPSLVESLASSVPDNGGVYLVPAFAGLGAPWWQPGAKALLCGMTLGTNKAHVARAALESIAYQVKDLVDLMINSANIEIQELRVDGGPTRNRLLMQFQADMLRASISRSDIEEASALGAMIVGNIGRHVWSNFNQIAQLRKGEPSIRPQAKAEEVEQLHGQWRKAVQRCMV